MGLVANKFQSTRPVWGATNEPKFEELPDDISIHAPRVGRDDTVQPDGSKQTISIHAPRVGRDR